MPAIDLYAPDATRRRASNAIMTFREWCARNSFSTVTGWRIMKSGAGPKVTQISVRRIGIREDHHAEWLSRRPIMSYGTSTATHKESITRT